VFNEGGEGQKGAGGMRFVRGLGVAGMLGVLVAGAACQKTPAPDSASSGAPAGVVAPGSGSAASSSASGAVSRYAPASSGYGTSGSLSPEPPGLPLADAAPLPDQDDPTIPADLPHVRRLFPKESNRLTFAIFGDRYWGDSTGWTIFDRAVDEVNRLRPAFVVDVGDHIDGMWWSPERTPAEWQETLEHAGRARMPWFLTPGNHDISGRDMYDYWRQKLGRTYYSFDRQGCHFLVLNTEEGDGCGKTGFTTAQVEWAKRDLAALDKPRHIFVFMHEPFFLADGYGEGTWAEIEAALKGQPYTVFAGHYHRLEKSVRDGHAYYLVGPCGAGFYGEPGRANGVFQQFMLVTVDGADVSLVVIEPGYVHGEEIIPLSRYPGMSGVVTPP